MRGGTPGGVLAAAREEVRASLESIRSELRASGMPAPEWTGKLIRPVVGLAGASTCPGVAAAAGAGLWRALAAVQLAHEASLLHDDVVDGASERRGEPTVVARQGVAAALVEGDHLLTAGYRLAARTGSLEFADLFAEAVERTVSGEKAQARSAGRRLEWAEYEAIVGDKSGELVGAALAAGATLRGAWDAHRYRAIGRRVGIVYQMLDDLLDYCPTMETGKPSLSDYGRGLWTWPRAFAELEDGLDAADVERRLRQVDASGQAPLERCLERFEEEVDSVAAAVADLLPDDHVLGALLESWRDLARAACAPKSVKLPPVAGWEALMAEHAKSFRFASRLFPAEHRERVVGVYAWCRYTDDLVDGVDLPPDELEARLDAWLALSRRAYQGDVTGNDLADKVMREMREADVPFGYAEEMIEGMRMDVRGTTYGSVAELRRYTFRVASVVGLWMTELFGIRDPWMLDRATALGHAMQLTNILRDVGEDLDAGRLYLPSSWLRAHDLDRGDLERMAETGEIDDRYRSLIERLLRVAESEYDHAAPAIDRLPDFYRRPVAVASEVYRGIHDAIRSNDYDNLTRRAYTGLRAKLRLGASALLRSRSRTSTPGLARSAAVFGAAALLMVPSGQGIAQGPAEAQSPVPVITVDRVEPRVPRSATDRIFLGLGELWVQGVDHEPSVDAGLRVVDRIREELGPVTPTRDRLLRAYRGSFLTLRAKHGGWPPERLRNLRAGFELMDAAVADAPDQADTRYVRLMSGFYLPGIFGRGDRVEEDLAALVQLLPESRDRFPDKVFPEVVRFVLENADPDPADRRALESLLP